jgi:high-affinity nickel-transport protein
MVFPALFTAGMSLVDTADGVMMLGAYGWALVEPARKLGYNVAITAGSVLVALVIGLLEAVDLAASRGAVVPHWTTLLDSHGELIGYGVVGSFALLWIGSLLGTRLAGRPALSRSR